MVVVCMSNEISIRIVSGSFVLTVGSILADLIGLGFSIVVARLLGPEGYGLWSISLVYPTMIAGLVDLGLGSIITRYAALPSKDRDVYIWTGIIFKCVLGCVGAIIVYVFANVFAELLMRPQLSVYIKILSIFTVSYILLITLASIFNGLGKYKISASINIFQFILRGILTILLVAIGLGVYGAIIACSVAYAILAISYSIFLYTKYTRSIIISRKALSEMIKLSIPLYLASISGIITTSLINTILARYVSDYDLGNYRVAINILAPVTALQNAISLTTLTSFPLFLTNSDNLENNFRKKSEEIVFYSSIIFTALALLYVSIIIPTTYLLYGRLYIDAPKYAMLYSIGIIIQSILGFSIFVSILIALGVTKWNAISTILGQLAAIVIALIFTPILYVYGIIISHIASSIVMATTILVIVRKFYAIRINIKTIFRALIPALLAFMVTQLALKPLTNIVTNVVEKIIGIISGISIYTLVYLLFLPMFVDRIAIKNIIILASKIEIIGKIIKFLGETYLKIINKY